MHVQLRLHVVGQVPRAQRFLLAVLVDQRLQRIDFLLVTVLVFPNVPGVRCFEYAEDATVHVAFGVASMVAEFVLFARALVHEPRVLILDEPTAGVDIEMRRSMYDFLRETNEDGRTIILTTHYLEEAEMLCRNVGIINQGKIVTDGAIRDLLRDLNSETFLLDTQEELPAGISIPGYQIRQVEAQCLEVEIEKGQELARVFTALAEIGVSVVSMRNKENRLERMFVNVLEGAS